MVLSFISFKIASLSLALAGDLGAKTHLHKLLHFLVVEGFGVVVIQFTLRFVRASENIIERHVKIVGIPQQNGVRHIALPAFISENGRLSHRSYLACYKSPCFTYAFTQGSQSFSYNFTAHTVTLYIIIHDF